MHNAVKHAQATRIDMVLTRDSENIRMEIFDNGNGFAFPAHPRGMGIRIMTWRAARIGATLAFEPMSPRGTRVTLEIARHPFDGNA